MHQQQRYNNRKTKICMFMHHMYVDILLPPTKAILIMFEGITTHYQTLHTFIGYNVMRYHSLDVSPHALPLALSYIFPRFSMV